MRKIITSQHGRGAIKGMATFDATSSVGADCEIMKRVHHLRAAGAGVRR